MEQTSQEIEKILKYTENITQGLVNSNPYSLQQVEKISNQVGRKLENIVDKEVFVPNKEQIAFLRAIFHPNTGPYVEEWTNKVGISEQTLGMWLANPQFVPWLVGEAEKRMMLFKLEWLKAGIIKMKNNVPTWVEMGKMFYPKGSPDFTPSEKGSRREKLEKEMKRLIELKEK